MTSPASLAASTVDLATTLAGLLILFGVIALGVWALRSQKRQFPDGFDRTGWNPEQRHASWLWTKFTWLSGGRG